MTLLSLAAIKAEVDRLAGILGACGKLLPSYGHNQHDAYPHIEVDPSGYHYVVVERGEEIRRTTTITLDDLLYVIFEGVTFSLAGDYEREHRNENEDSRRKRFARQTELLSQLSPAWAERHTQNIESILRQHPFDDNSLKCAILCKAIRDEGKSNEVAWEMACRRYPIPPGKV